jgi:hypothetical protein
MAAAAAAAFFFSLSPLSANTPDKVKILRENAKAFFDYNRARDPKAGDGFRRLIRMFGDHNEYTAAEVQIALSGLGVFKNGQIARAKDQNGDPPPGTLPSETVKARFATIEALDPAKKGLFERLANRVGNCRWYTFDQVNNAESFETTDEPTGEKKLAAEALQEAAIRGEKGEMKLHDGWQAPRIRHDWRDVLYDEDASVQPSKPKALGDLQGATFSYTRDQNAGTDLWAAHAAVIFPFTKHWPEGADFSLAELALAPSVTYDRVTTNGDPKVEVDSIFYRMGVFLDFFGLQPRQPGPDDVPMPGGGTNPASLYGGGYGLQVRAAGVYVTDHDYRAGLTGLEVDLEPRWMGNHLNLGYRTILWPKKSPALADGSDDAFLDAQLRVWAHLEGGEVQDVAASWLPSNESFFRVGPTVQFQLRAPALPGERTLSLTALYSYLAAVSGPSDHASYLQATLSYDLFRDKELNHKVSLNASYERGGLNLTKQDVDTFTLGLGVLF